MPGRRRQAALECHNGALVCPAIAQLAHYHHHNHNLGTTTSWAQESIKLSTNAELTSAGAVGRGQPYTFGFALNAAVFSSTPVQANLVTATGADGARAAAAALLPSLKHILTNPQAVH